jgi:hypothetical protein
VQFGTDEGAAGQHADHRQATPPDGDADPQIYDSGSITTTEDGELIYSDSSGNGFSSGG